MSRRVLYVQHAVDLGGSCMSLLATVQGLDPTRYRPVVALTHAQPRVTQLYESAHIVVVKAHGIEHFAHSQGAHVSWRRPASWGPLLGLARWQRTAARVAELVERTQPDLVHLNSCVMAPTAHALYRMRVPFVWHIREPPWHGVCGTRHRLLRMAILNWPNALIFLSARERAGWVEDQRGSVVHNFVDLQFCAAAPSRAAARRTLGIAEDAAVLLYVGGLAPIKGIDALLSALPHVHQQIPKLVCLMPGSEHDAPRSSVVRWARQVLPYFGHGTTVQRLEARLRERPLAQLCRRGPPVVDLRPHFAACDILVFPAAVEHFARPVVEAAAMGRPAVATDWPILRELVAVPDTGWLVRPGDVSALTATLVDALRDPERAAHMGAAAAQRARTLFNQRTQVDVIMDIYDQVLTGTASIRRVLPGVVAAHASL